MLEVTDWQCQSFVNKDQHIVLQFLRTQKIRTPRVGGEAVILTVVRTSFGG
jgi:hypothetical protein